MVEKINVWNSRGAGFTSFFCNFPRRTLLESLDWHRVKQAHKMQQVHFQLTHWNYETWAYSLLRKRNAWTLTFIGTYSSLWLYCSICLNPPSCPESFGCNGVDWQFGVSPLASTLPQGHASRSKQSDVTVWLIQVPSWIHKNVKVACTNHRQQF